jgi:hypothetical protein
VSSLVIVGFPLREVANLFTVGRQPAALPGRYLSVWRGRWWSSVQASTAGGTSGAAFSWLNSCGKQPRAHHDLSVAGIAAHRRLTERLRHKVAGVLGYGYEARWLDRAEPQPGRRFPDMAGW